MSELMTRLRLPSSSLYGGFMDYGKVSISDMILHARKHAEHMKAMAEDVLNAADEDFQIDLVRGSVVQHHVLELQKASKERTAKDD